MKTLVKLHILAIPYSFHVFSHIIDNHDLDYSQGNSKDISSIVKVRQTAFTQEEINGFSTPELKSSRLNTIAAT
ncbi:MAG TPA: hypothetical protein VF893_09245 [Candidatus Bathyarchaeia archaeon]